MIVLSDKLRQAIKTGIIDEDYKDYLAVEEISHDFRRDTNKEWAS